MLMSTKPWKAIGPPPTAITITIATTAHVQDFDGSSHIDIIDIICRLCLCNHRLGLLIQLFRLCFSIANCLIAGG